MQYSNPLLLWCATVLRQSGWLVLTKGQKMNIEQILQQLLSDVQQVNSTLQSLPEAVATAVVAALPPSSDPGAIQSALDQLNTAVANLGTQEGTDTSALEAAIANLQTTLGPVPTAPAS